MEPEPMHDSTKQVEQTTAKHLGARKEGSNLYESLIGYVTRAGQLGAFPNPATLVAVPHTLPGDQSGGQLEEGESADPVPRRFEMQRGRSYRRNFLNVSNSTAVPFDRRRETGIDLDAPDDPVLYMAWLRRKRGLVGLGRRVSSESGYCDEDRKLVLGHLGYRGQISRQFGRFSSDPLSMIRYQPRPGIIVSLYGTLQRHGQLEYSNLEREIFDADGMFDAGEVIWVNSGQASAVVKDMATGTHSEVEEVYGVSTRGFLLFTLPGLTEPVWTWPRAPEEAGGRDRPFYYETGRTENDVSGIVLESFTLAAGLLESYRDLSGITVPVLPVKRSTLSHRDHLAPTANGAHRS